VEIIYPQVAGIDVGTREIAVAVRTPADIPGQRRQRIRKYKTFYQVLLEMVAWLVEQEVTHVAMEATGVYRKPVFHALCEAEQIEVPLA
jgi:transposase